MASIRSLVLVVLFLKQTLCSEVRLGVLLPQDGDYPFALTKTLPGIQIAVQTVNRIPDLLPSHTLSVVVRDSKCSSTEAPVQAIELFCGGQVHGFIGPACDYAVSPVARYSPRWGIPVLTGGALANAFDDKAEFKLLTRLIGSDSKLVEGFLAVMRFFNWERVGLLYSKKTSGCHFKTQALHSAITVKYERPWFVSFDANSDNSYLDGILDQAKTKARVLVICADPDGVRNIMLRAHDRLVTEDYVFINIEQFESDSERNPWYRVEDTTENNEKARTAYEGLMTMSIRRPISLEYNLFSQEVNRRALASNPNYTSNGQVNTFVGAFHDSVILYAIALTETIQAGESITDGEAITRRMWNRTFEGITGTVSIDANGDRNMDYSLSDMNPQTGLFEVVANYYGHEKNFVPVEGKQIHWAWGRTEAPPDTPPCGFEGEKCPSEGIETEGVPETSSSVPDVQEDTTPVPTIQADISEPVANLIPNRKLTPDDVTQLQYEVLQKEKKKLVAETTYYRLMNTKLKKELNV